jgi:hypothetical protein
MEMTGDDGEEGVDAERMELVESTDEQEDTDGRRFSLLRVD